MKITLLDKATLGEDISLVPLTDLGECEIYENTKPEEVAKRIADTDVLVINKIKLNEENLCNAKNLKLICVAATGYDNIDLDYCKANEIAVCNVVGYSSDSVAQLTVALVLALSVNLSAFTGYVNSGEYTNSKVANKLTPVYHEIAGKKWGIVGYGNIGKAVEKVALALGCETFINKRNIDGFENAMDIDTLCRECDIITIHTPLSDETRNLISEERINSMKSNVILVNTARGAVTDEKAIANAIKNGKIGAFGTDVYSVEPFSKDHPFNEIKELYNVCLTPHMAWGSYEARNRCIKEISLNIKDFYEGGKKGRLV